MARSDRVELSAAHFRVFATALFKVQADKKEGFQHFDHVILINFNGVILS